MPKKSSDDIKVVEPSFIPGYVRLVNLTSSERDIPLRGGKGPHLLPFSRAWEAHISEPILKKDLTDAIRKMKALGQIDIVEVTA
jgi:hypothetical protein